MMLPEGCAEGDVRRQLGVPRQDMHFTEAIRPRTMKEVPICHTCQGRYDPGQFPQNVLFESGGKWDA